MRKKRSATLNGHKSIPLENSVIISVCLLNRAYKLFPLEELFMVFLATTERTIWGSLFQCHRNENTYSFSSGLKVELIRK